MGLTAKKGDCGGFSLLGPAMGLVAACAWQLPGRPLCQDMGERARVGIAQPGALPCCLQEKLFTCFGAEGKLLVMGTRAG